MNSEPTELAGIHEADTMHAHAWGALDYDDPDEFQTYPAQRLTPQRITALGLGMSLAAVGLAGAVALTVGGGGQVPTQVAAPATSTTTATTTTVSVTPTTVAPAPTTVTATPAPVRDTAREEAFLVALDGAKLQPGSNRVSYSQMPGSHGAYMGDTSAWMPGGMVVTYAYRACAAMARYPQDRERATVEFYEEAGSAPLAGEWAVSVGRERAAYMEIVAVTLCPRDGW